MCEVGNVQKSVKKKEKPDRVPGYLRKERNQRQGMALTALVYFEELGIDSIMVDEAHFYKNMAIFSKMSRVSGITANGAKKCTDMEMKCQYLTELNGPRGIVFATGTPISNTMCVRP